MRVALLCFGFAEYSAHLASALAERVDLLFMLPEQEAACYEHLLRNVHVQRFAAPRLRQPLEQVKICRRLLSHIRTFAPDIFHFQQGHLWFNFALRSLPRCRFVLTIHDYRTHPGDTLSKKTPQCIMNLGFRRADDIIVHTERLRRLIAQKGDGRSVSVHVIPIIQLAGPQFNSSPNHGPPTILFFGRIWKYKGLEYLIRAEPFITSKVPGAKIVIAGEGEDFGRYRKMMIHPDRFVVHNYHIDDSFRAFLFAQASIVVLPYIEASQSGVIPIAFAHAKPVVATNVGGLPEMVLHEDTGLCVPPRDEKALGEAIVRLLTDESGSYRMGQNGYSKLTTECSPSAVAQRTIDVYQLALAREHMIPPVGVFG